MPKDTKYVPILKWKTGERIGMRNMDEGLKDLMCPVLVVTRGAEPDKFLRQVLSDWGNGRPFYLDFHPTYIGSQSKFISTLLKQENSEDLCILPVLTVDKAEGYFDVLRGHSSVFTEGVALRVTLSELDELTDIQGTLLKKAKMKKHPVDLIVDCTDLPKGGLQFSEFIAKSIRSFLSDSKKTNTYRTIIVAGSSFPMSLKGSQVPQDRITKLPRYEWKIWRKISQQHPFVRYGDYGIDDPDEIQYTHNLTIIPHIRYTVADGWLIVRGHYDSTKPNDFTQYHTLSKNLQEHDLFCGKDYSWGDALIVECANKQCIGRGCNHGSPVSWVARGTNHHLTYVTRQVST